MAVAELEIQKTAHNDSSTESAVSLFSTDTTCYGIPVSVVREIMHAMTYESVVHAGDAICGKINQSPCLTRELATDMTRDRPDTRITLC